MEEKFISIKINPFQPNEPCDQDIFTGREKELQIVVNSLYKTYQKRPEHILVNGDRGMGKTSLANLVENMAVFLSESFDNQNIKYFTVFNSLGTSKNLDEVCIKILENSYRKVKQTQNKIYRVIAKSLKDNIKGFTFGSFGIQFDFKEDPKTVSAIFDKLIEDLWSKIKNKYTSMLIIIDETDSISNDNRIASFFKSLIETLNHDDYKRIIFLFTVTPMGLENLIRGHEAFPRLFTSIEMKPLDRRECNQLIYRALEKGEPKILPSEDFLKLVYDYSNGIPCFIHEICHSAFEVCEGKIIGSRDFVSGVLGTKSVKGAKDSIFDRHFRQKYTRDILSNIYREILHIIASFDKYVVKVSEILKKFNGNKKTCSTYLSRMVSRGILKKVEGKKGHYYIPERIFYLWLRFSEITNKYIEKVKVK